MSDTITGTTIAARYRITGLYRTGRMGDTYLARRVDDGSLVCVKLLDPAHFDHQERVRRFERELRITRSIQHPCTLSVLDAGRAEHGPFLVTEYVDGDSLSDVIAEQGALPAERAARIAARIAQALQAAHHLGVIHRDLAPTNVLVAGDDDAVKVADFGLSVLTESENTASDELTATGVKIGTPWYMAPEYIEHAQLDARADLYGLGVVLYEMLTGQRPYVGRPYEVMEMHVAATVPHPQAREGSVPGWLDALTVQLMAKDPAQRPAQAADVIRRIEEGLGTAVTMGPTPLTPLGVGRVAEPPALVTRLIAGNLHEGPASVPADLVRARSYVVLRLAGPSVADKLGWRPGWRVQFPDEPSSGLLDPEASPPTQTRRALAFAPGITTQAVQGVIGSADPGALLARSAENVQAHFDPAQPDAAALLDLWRQGRWETLEALCEATLAAAPLPAALVLKGAAKYERGRQGDGLRWVQEFHDRHAASAEAMYRAVAHLYLGLDRLQFGHRASAADHFRYATLLGGIPSAASRHEEITGSRPDVTPWVGRPFAPATLPRQDTGSPLDVAEACAALPDDQRLLVAFVGGRRRTPDHRSFVARLIRQLRGFAGVFSRALLVTAVHDDDADEAPHPADEALEDSGLPVSWLVDPAARWHRAVHPANLPCAYLLDAAFVCRYQGALDGVTLWESFARPTA